MLSLSQTNGLFSMAGAIVPHVGTSASQKLSNKSDDGGSMLTLSDDNEMLKQIQATHEPDGRKFDVKTLFGLVESILSRAKLHGDASLTVVVQLEIEDSTYKSSIVALLDTLSYTIERISCEISSKALAGTDAHAITLSIFNMLANYSWDAKLVLTLAAFALNYGEFWLLAQIYSQNKLAQSIAILKQLPVILEHTDLVKPRFDALNNLISVTTDVANDVVKFTELPSTYISLDVPELSTTMAQIPSAVYWTIRSVVVCATQITNLTTIGHESALSIKEGWEISTVSHKLIVMHERLWKQLDICNQQIEEQKNIEAYKMIVSLFEAVHIDNLKVLKALFSVTDDTLPLFDCSAKRRVSVDILRSKNVLLLISGTEISQYELSTLQSVYNEIKSQIRLEGQFEVVWMPIVEELNDDLRTRLENYKSAMLWHTIYNPALIGKAVIKFVKEKWHFKNNPMLTVLDPQGRVVCENAFHMIWTWGSKAFPFTSWREETLLREETWRLELLVYGSDETILNWINQDKYVLLFGGDDIEWVRNFVKEARNVAQASSISLETAYLGKSTKKKQVQQVIQTITEDRLTHIPQKLMDNFWTRLQSILFSLFQLGKADEEDLKIQEIKKLLSYEKEGGWALLCRGSNIVVNGHGSITYRTLQEYGSWRDSVPAKGFELSFKDHYEKVYREAHPCCRLEFPTAGGRIPNDVKCPDCRNFMKHFTTFVCCHEE